MNNQKSINFEPATWATNPLIRSCSLAARGLLIELVCLDQNANIPGLSLNTLSRIIGALNDDSEFGDHRADNVRAALRELYNAQLLGEVPGFEGVTLTNLKQVLPLFIFEEEDEEEKNKANGDNDG